MRVHVESNFVLELVLEQEQSEACEDILAMAEHDTIELCMPAYALLEPLETLHRREKRWKALAADVETELSQFERNTALGADVAALRTLTAKATKLATDRRDEVRGRLLKIASVLPTDRAVLELAETYVNDFGLATRCSDARKRGGYGHEAAQPVRQPQHA